MNIQMDGLSLVRLTQTREADMDCLIVTGGILAGSDGKVLCLTDAEKWLAKRFSGRPFDVGLKKVQGTFAVDGFAYPADTLKHEHLVSAQVGEISKTLIVYPRRTWQPTLFGWTTVNEGPLDSGLALSMENSYGGEGYADNPEGTGFVSPDGHAKGIDLPRLEDPLAPLQTPHTPGRCATFLPLPPFCLSRLHYMGTLDSAWKTDVAPFLPTDTDARWFNEVDEDQWNPKYWVGNETWAAHGLHPSGRPVSGSLPGRRVRLLLNDPEQAEPLREWPLDLDTVWLFPDEEKVLVLYRQVLPGLIDTSQRPLLGLVSESLDEPAATAQHWAAKLWPTDVAESVVEPILLEPPAFPSRDEVLKSFAPFIEAMEKTIDDQRQEAISSARSMIERLGLTGIELPSTQPRPLLDRMLAASGTLKPFDPEALQASLEQEVAAQRQFAIEQAKALAKKMNLEVGPNGLPLSPSQHDGSATKNLVDKLPLDASTKADLLARTEQLKSRAQQIEDEVQSHMAQLRADLEALPKIASPSINDFKRWERPDFIALASPQAFNQAYFDGLDLSSLDLNSCHFIDCGFTRCSFNLIVLSNSIFERCTLIDCDLSGAAFNEVNWIDTNLCNCDLSKACLTNAQLDDLRLTNCTLTSANLSAAQGKRLTLSDCTGHGVVLDHLQIQHFSAQDCDLRQSDAREAQLPGARFVNCTLIQMVFSDAQLPGAMFSGVDASRCQLTAANLRSSQIDNLSDFSGIDAFGADLSSISVQNSKFRSANLFKCIMPRAVFSSTDLSNLQISQAVVIGTAFHTCTLQDNDWRGANLMDVVFHRCKLENIDARGSNLHGAYLDRSKASLVDCKDALLTRSSFSGVIDAID